MLRRKRSSREVRGVSPEELGLLCLHITNIILSTPQRTRDSVTVRALEFFYCRYILRES